MITKFMFATGIECSYPTIAGGIRRDELAETGHYERWQEDLALVKELGPCVLRYGPPYYRNHTGPGQYEWEFTDQVFAELRRLEITPIVDLLHFGVPDWLGDYQNPEFPDHFAAYARAFAQRFPWVRFYTPVNEIYVAARFSALLGYWNERLRSHHAFVTALKHLCRASVLTMEAIREVRPDMVCIQSETAQYAHTEEPSFEQRADFCNQVRFLALDLHYAHQVRADVLLYLLDNGMTREEYEWFMGRKEHECCVLGVDYYDWNEVLLRKDGDLAEYPETFGWYLITHEYYARYKKPVMHTETNLDDADRAPAWLWKQWQNVERMREDGVPVIGFTWYSLIDQVDWDKALARKEGTINPSGLYDLDRKPRPVAHAFKELVSRYYGSPILKTNPLFGIG